jgi:hypothetical protein
MTHEPRARNILESIVSQRLADPRGVRSIKQGVVTMNQEILFVIPGAGGELEGRPALIEPETTAADLVQAAQLKPDQWQIQVKQNGQLVSLSSQDRVADYVSAGDKVFAVMSDMTVGLLV